MTAGAEDRDHDLLAAYALDAVDRDERARIEAWLRTDPEARAELDEHLEVLAALVDDEGPAPSDRVWDSIQSALDAEVSQAAPVVGPERAGGSSPVVVPFERRAEPRPRRFTVLAAAAVAAVALAVGAVAGTLLSSDDATSVRQMADDARGAADARIASLVDPDSGEVVAEAVVLPDGTAYLVSRLADLAPDRTYQLWGVAGERVISLGVLGAEGDAVHVFHVDPGFETFAVTEEIAGGVVASENPAVAVGSL